MCTSTTAVDEYSTSESEFYGIVRGAASGIQLREAFMQFGFSVRLRVLSDSSAARAMTARTGSGRVDTSHNTADLGASLSRRSSRRSCSGGCSWRPR